MEKLEDVLAKVELLRKNLVAVDVISPEKGHYELDLSSGLTGALCENNLGNWIEGGCSNCPYNQKYVIDENEVSSPDVSKIDFAKSQLSNFYESSSFYSARYLAGRSLGRDTDSEISSYVDSLRTSVNSPNPKVAFLAILDASKLYSFSKSKVVSSLLQETYVKNPFKKVRVEAGKALGHSNFGILVHEQFRKS